MGAPAEAIPEAADPPLRTLSEYYALEQLAILFRRFAHETDVVALAAEFGAIAEAASEAQFSRLVLLDAIGLLPGEVRDESVVEIGSNQFPLPDLMPELVRELITAAPARAAKETQMEQTHHTPTTARQLNGEQALAEPGFLARTIRRLRLPTLKETAIAAGVVLAGVAVWLALGAPSDATTNA